MRNKKVALTLISVLTAIFMILMLNVTVFATEEETAFEEPVVIETQPQEVVPEQTQAPQEPEYDFDDGDDDEGDEITSDPDSDSDYVEPDTEPQPEDSYEDNEYVEPTEVVTEAPTYYDVYSDELPEVESQMIVMPTSIEPPEIEVSDTSLMGGVIAWLCVAVGIAVIAGVLVSQRTRQNTGNRR